MPADGPPTEIGESSSLTLILKRSDILYYEGSTANSALQQKVQKTSYSSSSGIGAVIRAKQERMDQSRPGFAKDLMLLIKPSDESLYKNLVNALNEILINDVPRYAIVKLSPEDEALFVEGSTRLSK